MRLKLYLFAITAATGVLLTACSDDDEYEMAAKPDSSCIAAYFNSENETSILLTPEDIAANPSITLKVSRENSTNAASVPVIVDSKTDILQIPSTVNFAAGESTADLVISFDGMQAPSTNSFSIHLGEDYVNPYIELSGSDRFNCTILAAQWVKVMSNAKFNLMTWSSPEPISGIDTVQSDIYWLEGQNKFRIENFLGTGFNVTFKIAEDTFDPENKSTWTGTLQLLDHFDNESWGSNFHILVDDSGAEMQWTMGNSSLSFEMLAFYKMLSGKSYINLNGNIDGADYAGYLGAYATYTDGSAYYCYVYISE